MDNNYRQYGAGNLLLPPLDLDISSPGMLHRPASIRRLGESDVLALMEGMPPFEVQEWVNLRFRSEDSDKLSVLAKVISMAVMDGKTLCRLTFEPENALEILSSRKMLQAFNRRGTFRATPGELIPISLESQGGHSATGELKDISARGIGVYLELDDKAHDEFYTLSFPLPGVSDPIRVKATARHRTPLGNRSHCGYEFVFSCDKSGDRQRSLIEQYVLQRKLELRIPAGHFMLARTVHE